VQASGPWKILCCKSPSGEHQAFQGSQGEMASGDLASGNLQNCEVDSALQLKVPPVQLANAHLLRFVVLHQSNHAIKLLAHL